LSVARSGEVPVEGDAIDQEMISDARSLEDHLMTLAASWPWWLRPYSCPSWAPSRPCSRNSKRGG
jgi:hypothetical protein